ncbi:MAG: hypothetical protein V3R49_00060 [Gammaproteobacteria bacterium]
MKANDNWYYKFFTILTVFLLCLGGGNVVHADEPLNIGSRLELFVDYYMIEKLEGVQLKLHTPQLAPLSANPPQGGYATVIKDGNLYRLYHRDSLKSYKGQRYDGNPGEITCYMESHDGINWISPNLGLNDVDGTKENNVIFARAMPYSHNFSPFLDHRPSVPAEQRFKALAGVKKGGKQVYPGGLHAFISADGIHWKKLRDKAVIKYHSSAFDSQNVSFWSEYEQCYVCFFRTWTGGWWQGLRTISRTTSKDFVNWTKPEAMNPNAEGEHLYTSQTHPYFRAPHIYIATPTRLAAQRGALTDIVFMSSRGGNHYERTFLEAFIRPGFDPKHWTNRANYAALNVVPTTPTEMSIYISQRRYFLRTDGFVSVNAPYKGGQMLTKPFIFDGKHLIINYSTAASGSMQVEVQNLTGEPLEGFSLADCAEFYGNSIEHTVNWKNGNDLGKLASTPLRLRFIMKDADLFSLRFSD